MKVNFDITKIVFTPYCDNYDFTLGITRDNEGDECYLGIDIPCKDDAEWRFWLLFEDDNVAWNISNEDKEYVKQEAIKHCLYIEKIILIHGYQKKHLINQKKF